ncbi:hypothetical protein CDV31_016648 [Fusarium ambrosium]|uniref:Transcriptional activator HAP2 n=1 Tax=Fusarium ambrosium TaxID=131363 RepID=A0A428S5B8_9HYPO|nr:hypothetical protein CDV31_016648 [Fusarium ambrosium]
MSPLDQTHHRHPIPLDSQAHIPATKPAETEEIAFRINVKQAHRILKRRAARQKFKEKIGLDWKSRRSYVHESLHNHAMRWPRGPDGRFLSRAEVTAMANGNDGKGDEGCGHINTTFDALIVFEACLSGKLIPIFRRPESTELPKLIQSGNVFVYKVEESGIKRWKDDVSWSSGRDLERFQFYQELEPSPMPVKKREFKKNGLVKKTIGITYQSVTYRLVSYYKCEDVEQGRFLSPSQHHELRKIVPRDELLTPEFSASINTTGMNSTLEYSHGSVPMTYTYSSPIVQQGEISMDYSTGITDGEIKILKDLAPKIVNRVRVYPVLSIFELGTGDSTKITLLLDLLEPLNIICHYYAVDINEDGVHVTFEDGVAMAAMQPGYKIIISLGSTATIFGHSEALKNLQMYIRDADLLNLGREGPYGVMGPNGNKIHDDAYHTEPYGGFLWAGLKTGNGILQKVFNETDWKIKCEIRQRPWCHQFVFLHQGDGRFRGLVSYKYDEGEMTAMIKEAGALSTDIYRHPETEMRVYVVDCAGASTSRKGLVLPVPIPCIRHCEPFSNNDGVESGLDIRTSSEE